MTPPAAFPLDASGQVEPARLGDRQLAVAVDVDELGVDGHAVAGLDDVIGVVGHAEHQLEGAGRGDDDLPVGADLPVGGDPYSLPLVEDFNVEVRIGRLQPITDVDIVGHPIAVGVQRGADTASVLPVPVAGIQRVIPEQERSGFDREAGGVGAEEVYGDIMAAAHWS